MTPRNQPARQRILFLSYLYPSFSGSGSQIRCASLLRMLAERHDVYLLVVNRFEKIPGPPDALVESLCKKAVYLRTLPGADTDGKWHTFATEVASAEIAHRDCKDGESSDAIMQFYRENDLGSLFVFRLECYPFMEKCHSLLPVRYLDLDELVSRRENLIADLKRQANTHKEPEPYERRMLAVWRIMEKAIIPRFQKIFVASDFEAEQVRKHVDSDRIHVLPNIAPPRLALPAIKKSGPHEILFVGTLSYYPNEDAVHYFSREIFPSIRAELGDDVVFKIVGFGSPKSLQPLRNEPGVFLEGFQKDLTPFYTSASLIVVPLRAGTGTRLKILEAFSYGRPVVSTSIGAQGLKVTHGENILLADDPKSFATACLDVLRQSQLSDKLITRGRQLQQESYSHEALLRSYDEVTGAGHEVELDAV